jgi:hypothetical protein
VVGVALVGFVGWKSRGLERERLEIEAESAEEHVEIMPGADERVEDDHHPIDVHAEEERGLDRL